MAEGDPEAKIKDAVPLLQYSALLKELPSNNPIHNETGFFPIAHDSCVSKDKL